MRLFSRIPSFYKERISNLVLYCSNLDSRKTAFTIASAVCLGTIPLIGLTLILTTGFGLIFRLNQYMLQSVHMLVSPLQIILFYPFIRTGQFVFRIENNLSVPVKQLPAYIYSHTGEFIHAYLKVMLAATGVWFIVSLAVGYGIFRIILFYFPRAKAAL